MSSYILNSGIYQIDPQNGSVLNTYQAPFVEWGGYSGLAATDTSIWVADFYSGPIIELEIPGLRVLDTIPSPFPPGSGGYSYLHDLAFDGKYLWVAGSSPWVAYVLKIDPRTKTIVDSLIPPTGERGITFDGKY